MVNEQEGSGGLTATREAGSELYPWYDSRWLTAFSKAKATIRSVRPESLPDFLAAFHVLRTRPDFDVKFLERVFDDGVMDEIRQVAASLRPTDLELHEARTFGRFVVHDHPYFTELQERTIPLVSEAAGEPVDASYNFLSLYGKLGVCPAHIDSPEAKWTLDLCVNQAAPWPIHFSQVVPWPDSDADPPRSADWEIEVKQSSSLRFTNHTLEPGQAVLFSGSSQWHYRDAIVNAPGGQVCDLLFFHFIPRGTAALIRPDNWAALFGIPELANA